MAGAVVLGIFALVYVQSAQNRTNFSQITSLMSFRESVMTYYSSVVANRGTWECTIRANTDLRRYLASGTAVSTNTALEIRDYTGNCQEKLASPVTSGKQLIASSGLGLNAQDTLPVAPARTCDDTINGTHFCLKAEWKRHAIATGRRGVVVTLKLTANRKAIKEKLDVNFDLKDKEHDIYMTRTVATDCSDGRVTGHFPGNRTGPVRGFDGYINTRTAPHPVESGVAAYAGDAAVVDFDAVTDLVECSRRGPLVVPPCYDLTSRSAIRGINPNPFLSGSGMVGWYGFVDPNEGFGSIDGNARLALKCDGRGRSPRTPIKGSCPRTSGSGTTAIAYFDPQTGIAQCSHPNILVEEVTTSVCNGDNQHGVVQLIGSGNMVGTFECSSTRWRYSYNRRVGIEPGRGRCGTRQAITGFDSTGRMLDDCIRSDGLDIATSGDNAMRGLRGPRGERGDDGDWLRNKCRNDSGCLHTNTYDLGYGNTITHAYGPGVGPQGPRGASVTCPSGCYRTETRYSW